MPSKSPAQRRLMAAAAHTKGGFAGVPQSVGKEFLTADKRTNMKKVKKMADGGIAGLGSMIGSTSPSFGSMATSKMPASFSSPSFGGGGGGGGSAQSGLGAVNQGAQTIGSALSRAASAIGGGDSGGGLLSPAYKKGGKVTTTRRVSTGSSSKKSNW